MKRNSHYNSAAHANNDQDPITRRSPSPPTSILQQKRRVQGRDAHEFVGGKSRRLEEVSARTIRTAVQT